ncbi:MAG TPA: hypothetical protein VN706_11250 [Gemmatimonadaceae bacterium]|nr:hypothetical protein [Gemmatimonadaceae bacterium]
MGETRRYRGLVRISLTAGVALSAVAVSFFVVGLASGLVPASVFGPREVVAIAVRAFCAGVVAGGLFSAFAMRGGRGHTLATLSTWRVALWGALATGSIPLLQALGGMGSVPLSVLAAATALAGIGGGVASALMLRLARRSTQRLAEAEFVKL